MTDTVKEPLVSIIVRTKDRPRLLKRALQSIAAQTHRPLEVVLVNDGGCDLDIGDVQTILGEIRLNYIRLEENQGRSEAGNVGITNARGEYLGFLDDDDELTPEHVITLVSFLEKSDYSVAYTDSLMVYLQYDPQELEFRATVKKLLFSRDFDYHFLLFENYIPFLCLMFRRNVLIETGGFDSNFDLYEDWDLLIRTAERYPFYHIRKTTAEYNQWSSDLQISQRNRDSSFLKQSYLKVLSRHSEKVVPETIHDYMSNHVVLRHDTENLRSELAQTRAELSEKILQIGNLQSIVQEKDNVIGGKDAHINNLEAQIDLIIADRDRDVAGTKEIIKEKDARINNLEAIIVNKNLRLGGLEKLLGETKEQLNGIYGSHGWKVLLKYYRLRDKLLPEGTSRRKVAKRLLNIAISERKPAAAVSDDTEPVMNKPFRVPKLAIAETPENVAVVPAESTVSIVIPTKDAGRDFEHLLSALKGQRGMKGIEIVVVDSGSTDDTVVTAKEYGATIVHIEPENFSHSRARNLGAEHTNGDCLLFITQDVMPSSDLWLYELMKVIENSDVVAASCVEYPREDADLFYRVVSWHHRRYLDVEKHDRVLSMPDNENHISLRKNAQLSDIACLISKPLFSKYMFRGKYAEDLDLGIRLIRDGYKCALLSSTMIIHSHNRSAYYHLRRGYVDNVFLSDIFPDHPLPSIKIADLIKGTLLTLFVLDRLVNESLPKTITPCSCGEFVNTVRDNFEKFAKRSYGTSFSDFELSGENYFDHEFRSFLVNLCQLTDYGKGKTSNNPFIDIIRHYLDMAIRYLLNTYEVIDDHLIEDFKAYLYKSFANQLGGYLAYCYLKAREADRDNLRGIHDTLLVGV